MPGSSRQRIYPDISRELAQLASKLRVFQPLHINYKKYCDKPYDIQIHVHSRIIYTHLDKLAAKSRYFRSLRRAQPRGRCSRLVLKIEYEDHDVIKCLVEYCYRNRLNLEDLLHKKAKVLVAAHKYQFDEIEAILYNQLEFFLDYVNFNDVLEIPYTGEKSRERDKLVHDFHLFKTKFIVVVEHVIDCDRGLLIHLIRVRNYTRDDDERLKSGKREESKDFEAVHMSDSNRRGLSYGPVGPDELDPMLKIFCKGKIFDLPEGKTQTVLFKRRIKASDYYDIFGEAKLRAYPKIARLTYNVYATATGVYGVTRDDTTVYPRLRQ